MKGYGLRTGNPLDKRLYEIWRKMHYRCENEKHPHFKNYGGRGIKVCEEWNSFVYFASWAIKNGYSEELTLDRIDNNKNYEPSNCRWATKKVQSVNRRIGCHVTQEIKTTKPSPVKNVKTKSFSVRQRTKNWEYRIEDKHINGKRHQISKGGFPTKEEAIAAAKAYIIDHDMMI